MRSNMQNHGVVMETQPAEMQMAFTTEANEFQDQEPNDFDDRNQFEQLEAVREERESHPVTQRTVT